MIILVKIQNITHNSQGNIIAECKWESVVRERKEGEMIKEEPEKGTAKPFA